MATLYVDNRPYTVKDGQNLLQACLTLGFDLPYFCWHPALHSVGACRQCAVKQFTDAADTRGKIVMACMTPAADGTRISIDDPEARAFRAAVIEWLMVNHPHDCPVCDEGGECHLQDMTVMTGHTYREFRFRKRTHRNQDLGPFINHEMNRCIACYRCVRFYRDYAGGRDLDVFAWHDSVYFGRHADGPLESEFSGNLVEVCPTGVFTDKTLKRHSTRKWDLETAPSVCVHCGVGCNTLPGARYGRLRRILNRHHSDVNGYFLCDRGRFGYEFVNPARPEATKGRGVEDLAGHVRNGGVIGIGSPRASLEANFALRALVGPERFYQGVSTAEHRLISTALDLARRGPARVPSLREIAEADAALVLGEDVTNTAPMMALALRQIAAQANRRVAAGLKIPPWDDFSVRQAAQAVHDGPGGAIKPPLFVAGVAASRLDDAAQETFHAAPDDLARLGFAVAHAIDPANAPAPDNLDDRTRQAAERVAAALRSAERPTVVSGPGCGSVPVLQAAAAVAEALVAAGRPAGLVFAMPECNSLGLVLLGGAPLTEALSAVTSGAAQTVIVLENDLYRRAEAAAIDALFAQAKHVVVLDGLETATTAKAEAVLAAATFAESDGTLVNYEGRAQRYFKVVPPVEGASESWRQLRDLCIAAGRLPESAWPTITDVQRALAAELPVFADVPEIAPPPDFRVAGQRVPRQPPRSSGRTAMHTHRDVHEPAPPADPDSPLAFSMEGFPGDVPAALTPRYWAPGWNSVQALNKFQADPLGGGTHKPLTGTHKRLMGATPKGSEGGTHQDTSKGTLVPAAFVKRAGEWLVAPLYHIFGSEELSARSPGIAERAPRPYVALRPDEAQALGLSDGETVEVALGSVAQRVSVRVEASLPAGVAGLPVGLPGMPFAALPAWGVIRKPAGSEVRHE
jgi:NADH-quinone oxidoreductase subunit G